MDFDDWVVAVFDESVEDPFPTPAEDLAHLTRLFTDPTGALDGLTDEEIGVGLWSVLDSGGAGTALAMNDGTLPLEGRLACIRLVPHLYRELFVPRCEERLGHLSGQGGRLEMICYMFWDVAVGAPAGTREGNLLEDAVTPDWSTTPDPPAPAASSSRSAKIRTWNSSPSARSA